MAAVLIAALTGWFFLLGPGATATVPSVQGRGQAQALSAVHQAALDATVTQAFSETVPRGGRLGRPRPGSTLRRGADVALWCPRGPSGMPCRPWSA